MNKKLFSWKALAGLALLVAMGLTSCKPGAEVDPSDPTGQTKPTTPSTSTKGSADLTFTITNDAKGDMVSLYNAWVAANGDAAKELVKKSEITLAVNAGGYKLDVARKIVLPKIWADPTDKTLNVIFNGAFADVKKGLEIDAETNLSKSKLNVSLPTNTFDLKLTADNIRTTLTSAAGSTIGTLTGSTPSATKDILTISDNVTVNVLDLTNNVKVAGSGNVVATKLAAGTYTGEKDGTIKTNGLNFKNIVANGKVEVKGFDGDHKLALNEVEIADANTLVIGANVAEIKNIKGNLDSNKKLQANVETEAIVGKLNNVIVALPSSSTETEIAIKDGSLLSNVEFTKDVVIPGDVTVSSVIFDGDVEVVFDENDLAFAFNDVLFGSSASITVTGEVENEEVKTYATYTYSVASGWTKEAKDDTSLAVNTKIAKFDGTKFVDADGNEVVVAEDKVRIVASSVTNTTVPEGCSITFDKKSVDNNALNATVINNLFGAPKNIDPGFAVVLDGTKYVWKKTSDSGTGVKYELRK